MAADTGVRTPTSIINRAQRKAAEERAERIVSHLATAADEIAQAILDEDWTAMGLSPEEWRARLFGDQRLTVEGRRRVHELLSGEGMTTRQIGDATGTPRETVRRDLTQNGSPRPDQATRHESVTREPKQKTSAERSRGYRQRKQRPVETVHLPDAGPDELARLREQAKEELRPEFEERFRERIASLDARVMELEAEVTRLKAENLQLRRELGLPDEDGQDPEQAEDWPLE